MKPAIFTLALILCLMSKGITQTLRIFEDVPKGTWEYSALAELEKSGEVTIHASDTEHGEAGKRILTRYEFAIVTKRTQDFLASKNVHIRNEASVHKLVHKLAIEFASELKAMEIEDRRAAKMASVDAPDRGALLEVNSTVAYRTLP